MKIYTKILIPTLFLVLVSLVSGAGVTYYLSKRSINDITTTWLETRLSEAVRTVEANEEFLRRYGIVNLSAGDRKAKYDALLELKHIIIGNYGFLLVVSDEGKVLLHPDGEKIGGSVGGQEWFSRMKQMHYGAINISWVDEDYFCVFEYYWPWGWYIAALDPHHEVYGAVNKTRNYVLVLAVAGSVFFALLMIVLVRRLTAPLRFLVYAAEKIGEGRLETRIPVATRDEFGQLSQVFNDTAAKLQKSLGDLQQSEQYFRSLIENASDVIILLNEDGTIRYLSPSIKHVLGFDGREMIGRPAGELIHTDDRPKFDAFWVNSLDQEAAGLLTDDFGFLHRDGSCRLFETTSRNLLDDLSVGGVVLNARDITLRKQFESELLESEKRLRSLTTRLLTAQESERKRLSIELHDEIGQSLTVLKLKVTMIERKLLPDQVQCIEACEDALAFIDQVIEEVRRLCNDLTPSALEDLGLTAALTWTIEEFARHNALELDLNLAEIDHCFSQEKQILIYRICQETLTNIGKHAQASHLKVLARENNDGIYFLIEDNGRGFDPESVRRRHIPHKGQGLTAIHERVRMLGASVRITSSEGRGAKIEFTAPREDVET